MSVLENIKNKKKAKPSEELIALRGNVEEDKPYWEDYGYTAEEWKVRKYFESHLFEDEGVIGMEGLSEFEV